MSKQENVVEVEFDCKNRNWYYRPLQRSVRGRFLLSRVAEPTAVSFRDRIPEDIPAQRLSVNVDTGEACLVEPIHQKPEIKSKIEKRGFQLEPERQEFSNVEVGAWLYWFRAAVDAGKATVVTGELPKTIEYDPPSQLAPQPKRGPARLREIFRNQPDVAAQYMEWPEPKRKEWEQLVGV